MSTRGGRGGGSNVGASQQPQQRTARLKRGTMQTDGKVKKILLFPQLESNSYRNTSRIVKSGNNVVKPNFQGRRISNPQEEIEEDEQFVQHNQAFRNAPIRRGTSSRGRGGNVSSRNLSVSNPAPKRLSRNPEEDDVVFQPGPIRKQKQPVVQKPEEVEQEPQTRHVSKSLNQVRKQISKMTVSSPTVEGGNKGIIKNEVTEEDDEQEEPVGDEVTYKVIGE